MKGTRLDETWQPDESLLAWAKGRRPDLDMSDTIESFKDYWIAKTGQSATKLDWRRTFRNWVRTTRGSPVKPPTRPAQAKPIPTSRTDREANVARLGAFLADMFGGRKAT